VYNQCPDKDGQSGERDKVYIDSHQLCHSALVKIIQCCALNLGWLDSTCRDLPVCTPSLIFTLRPAIIQRIDVDGFIERVV
jgi:hypothetical protein